MVVGLGTGSTAFFAVERVGEKLKDGSLTDIKAIPTSIRTKEQAESLGIPLVTLDTHSRLDVAIDGADSVDPQGNLVKGGGGALFREKIVEMASDKFIVIVDQTKVSATFFPVCSQRTSYRSCLVVFSCLFCLFCLFCFCVLFSWLLTSLSHPFVSFFSSPPPLSSHFRWSMRWAPPSLSPSRSFPSATSTP